MTKVIKIVSREKPYIKVVSRIDLRQWGMIFGDIQNQADLIALLENINPTWGNINGYIDQQADLMALFELYVKTVNGVSPDVNGNVQLDASDVGADPSGSANTAETNAKSYADSLVVGLWDDRGIYDASTNLFPAAGGSGAAGAILKGDIWTISVGGTIGGSVVAVGDTVRALSDTPGQIAGNWAIAENNIGYVPENSANKDESGGYVGLSGFKLKIKNALGTIISLISNTNTAIRNYTLQDRDGILADDTDLALKANINPRVSTIASSTTPSLNIDSYDRLVTTALSGNITTTTITGTPAHGRCIIFETTDNGTARAIARGASFVAGMASIPTTTVINKTLYEAYEYDSAISKWKCYATGINL